MAPPRGDPRRIAWHALRDVEDGAFADAALARRLIQSGLDDRDRGLATQLVYGTLAWQGLADHLLDAYGRPAPALEAEIRTLLRLALYQLIKLDRVPDFATVDTAVELAKTHKGGRAAGLVNALLRRFLRAEKHVPLPDDEDAAGRLAVTHSHPRWLVQRWLDVFGRAETESLLAANNGPAPTVLRVNLRRSDRAGAIAALQRERCRAEPTSYSPTGLECALRSRLTALSAFRDGLVTAQGEASQLVAEIVPDTARAILDACAAPGGKATHLAERAPAGARITAVDISPTGVARVSRQAARLGVEIACIGADASALPLRGDVQFDAVLVDAPCSGLGTLRQHPEIRWRRQPTDITRLANVQAAILDEMAPRVRTGGHLIYATCTVLPEENEDRVSQFLAAHADYVIDDPRRDLPATARTLVGEDRFLRTLPHRHGLDGFFAARLMRHR